MQVSVHEAKTQLSKLLDLIQDGEEVVIHRHGEPVARLVPAGAKKPIQYGAMRGTFKLKKGWDRPLTDKEADDFWEGKW